MSIEHSPAYVAWWSISQAGSIVYKVPAGTKQGGDVW